MSTLTERERLVARRSGINVELGHYCFDTNIGNIYVIANENKDEYDG